MGGGGGEENERPGFGVGDRMHVRDYACPTTLLHGDATAGGGVPSSGRRAKRVPNGVLPWMLDGLNGVFLNANGESHQPNSNSPMNSSFSCVPAVVDCAGLSLA